ncbi:alkaline phosphatase D family protein [Halocola ammonii]
MKYIRLVILFICFVPLFSNAQTEALRAGPMLTFTEMREVGVWLQTREPSTVMIEYSNPVAESSFTTRTKEIVTTDENFGIAKFEIGLLEPGTTYSYTIYLNGSPIASESPLTFTTQPLWQQRTGPPNFSLAIGSCAYVNEKKYEWPGKLYGSGYEIFESIYEKRPDAMLWLGDNVYLREPDWYSRSGIFHRYSHTRSLPELQPLLASCPHYAIWDDHDFGPDDSNGSFVQKDLTKEAFNAFWSDDYMIFPDGGITQQFRFGDMDFFLLDNRWWRTDPDLAEGKKQMLGKEQIDWLILALKSSSAPFKFVAVGGQVLNDHVVYENYSNFAKEREELLKRIDENNIQNVIFLTGDRHKTELSKLEMENVTLYDFTCSPLTSKAYDFNNEKNSLSLERTQVAQRNFGILEFSGTEENRKTTIRVFDSEGEELWSEEIFTVRQ